MGRLARHLTPVCPCASSRTRGDVLDSLAPLHCSCLHASTTEPAVALEILSSFCWSHCCRRLWAQWHRARHLSIDYRQYRCVSRSVPAHVIGCGSSPALPPGQPFFSPSLRARPLRPRTAPPALWRRAGAQFRTLELPLVQFAARCFDEVWAASFAMVDPFARQARRHGARDFFRSEQSLHALMTPRESGTTLPPAQRTFSDCEPRRC